MGALLVVIWLAGTIASIWFFIRPSPVLPMYATRGRAVMTGAAILIGLPVIGAITGISKAPSPDKVAATTTATDADNAADGNSQGATAPTSSWT